MNSYIYEELKVGMKESFSVKISPEMQSAFCLYSGDINPLHINQEYAISAGFSDKVVFGMLTASFYSTLAGVYLPGKFCLLQSVETNFIKPVYIGDMLSVNGEIKEKHDGIKQIVIKVNIFNQKEEKVSRGIIKAGVLNGK